MGRPEGKEFEPESHGVECAVEAYSEFGHPREWAGLRPLLVGFRLLNTWPVTWLAVAATSAYVWAVVWILVHPWCSPVDVYTGALAAVPVALATQALWIHAGHELAAFGPAATRWTAFALAVLRVPTLLALAGILGVFGSGWYLGSVLLADLTYWPDLALYLWVLGGWLGFRLGGMAVHEAVLGGSTAFESMAWSWRLTRGPALGFALPLGLNGLGALACRMLVTAADLGWPGPLAPAMAIVSLILALLVPVWVSLTWTAFYLRERARATPS